MKILIVKMSSLGDVVHCLPAVTDLLGALPPKLAAASDKQQSIDSKQAPSLVVDWVVEEAFAAIPAFHPGIRRVIPVAIRRWRKSWLSHRAEIKAFRKALRSERYDLIIDAQGLVKSAMVAGLARGPVAGFDKDSAREPLAATTYRTKHHVPKGTHAVHRQRLLFSEILGYSVPDQMSYGLAQAEPQSESQAEQQNKRQIFFFHGTTWPSKHWPDNAWLQLAELCSAAGYEVILPYLDEAEQRRAELISRSVSDSTLLPPGSLSELGKRLSTAAAAVSVDTGLGHLAAAFDVPLVAVYGSTSPELTGITGRRQISLSDSHLDCAPCLRRTCKYQPESSKIHPPCFEKITAERVWHNLMQKLPDNK